MGKSKQPKAGDQARCGHCGYEGIVLGQPTSTRVSAPWCPKCKMNDQLTKIDENTIVVTEWINSWDVDKKKYKKSVGGMGGWFNFHEEGKRWKDYLEEMKEKYHPYLEAIRMAVLRTGNRATGDDHQHALGCVPLFSDKTVGQFSFRGWGDLMAAIWSENEDKDYNYMDFYM